MINSKIWRKNIGFFGIKDFENILNILNDTLLEKNKHKQNDININLAQFVSRFEENIKVHFKR